jgi:molybdate transport system substrate-binding protein
MVASADSSAREAAARQPAVRAALIALALLAGIAGTARAAEPTIFAAASLSESFPKIDSSARYSFGGSNTLALQIREGAPADVFASAAPDFTQELFAAGLVEKPRFLAFNRLVVIVPRSDPADIDSVYDLNRDGIKLVVAGPRVPVGSYTRTALRDLGLTSALKNIVSEEQDVKDVVGKVVLGQADAGVVYVTDARVASSELITIRIPAFAQPKVRYEIAVVRSSANRAEAQAFVARATGRAGRRVLASHGFRFPATPTARGGDRR